MRAKVVGWQRWQTNDLRAIWRSAILQVRLVHLSVDMKLIIFRGLSARCHSIIHYSHPRRANYRFSQEIDGVSQGSCLKIWANKKMSSGISISKDAADDQQVAQHFSLADPSIIFLYLFSRNLFSVSWQCFTCFSRSLCFTQQLWLTIMKVSRRVIWPQWELCR